MNVQKDNNRIKFLVFVLVLLLLLSLGKYLNIDTTAIEKFLKGFPLIYAAALYVVLYVVVTFFIFFSKDIFWILGAVLFGAYISAALILISEIINAAILFNLSRYLGRQYVEYSLKGKYANLDEKLSRLNFFWLFIFRAAPLIPYRFLDLGFGLTKISLRKYLIAVILGSPLKIFWIQYILTGVGKGILSNPLALSEYFLSNKSLFMFSFIYVIFVILVVIKLKLKE